jgi:hypothetical protein
MKRNIFSYPSVEGIPLTMKKKQNNEKNFGTDMISVTKNMQHSMLSLWA